MSERTILVGLTVREAEHEWRRLLTEERGKYLGRRFQVSSVENITRWNGLRGFGAETELMVMDRAFYHRDAHALMEAVCDFKQRTGQAGE